jgi:hypothetical protein
MEQTENKRDTRSTAIVKKRGVRHGLYSWLKTGRINPSIRGHKRLQRYLREIEADLIRDLGGNENLTTAQEVLVKTTVQAYGCLLLAGAYTQKYSILRPDQARKGILELQPVLSHQFIAFLNCVRQNLIALGLDRKEREPLTLEDVIREHDEKGEEQAKAAGNRATVTQDGRSQGQEAAGEGQDGEATGEAQGEGEHEDDDGPGEAGQEDRVFALLHKRPLVEGDLAGLTAKQIKDLRSRFESEVRSLGIDPDKPDEEGT